MARIELTVKGIDCCERRVSDVLARLEGVREAKADRIAERVSVRFDSARVGEEALRAQVEQAGYEVVG